MKRNNVLSLLLSGVIATIFLAGCGNNPAPTSTGTSIETTSEEESTSVHVHSHDNHYEHDEFDHWHVCSECGEIFDKEHHHGGESSCVKKAICEVCGAEYGELDEHQYGEWKYYDEEYHAKECAVCHDLVKEAHKYTLERVGKEYLVDGPDSFKEGCDAVNRYYKSCFCGAHSTDDNDVFEVSNHHEFTLEIVLENDANLISPATCTEPAVYGKVCEHCHTAFSDELTFEYGEPKGHSFEEYLEELTFATYHSAYAYCTECHKYFVDQREEGAAEPNYVEVDKDIIFDDTKKQYGQEQFGTEENPYVIASEIDLFAFRNAVNSPDDFSGKFLILTNDITLNEGEEFGNCIGLNDSTPFSGTLDGKNHTISNVLKTKAANGTDPAKDAIGLFSRITNGTVKNLVLDNIETHASGQRAAGLVARARNAYIDNVVIMSGTITTDYRQAGGIAAVTMGDTVIKNCLNKADVTFTATNAENDKYSATAGIVGHTYSGTLLIENCTNEGKITSQGTGSKGLGTGGIIGSINGGAVVASLNEKSPTVTIKNCTNNGSVESSGEATGGIAGQLALLHSNAFIHTIEGCTNNGLVKGASIGTGGIVGSTKDTGASTTPTTFGYIIKDNENKGSVEGVQYVGGIIGIARLSLNDSTIIQGNKNYANVTGTGGSIGGIAGLARVSIKNCGVLNTVIIKRGDVEASVACGQTITGGGGASDKKPMTGYIAGAIGYGASMEGCYMFNADGNTVAEYETVTSSKS